MVNVSVITPVWNRADLTHKFLFQNWGFYVNTPEIEFIIIDNGSTDNTPQILKMWGVRMREQLRVITNEENLGFGPANNQGAEAAKGQILVFLSNDVLVSGDYAGPISAFLVENPKAIAGPQLLTHDTGWNTFNGQSISYLFGWCFFCLKSTWQGIGGFDPQFVPCDYEDIDLSMQAVKAGYELKELKLPLQHISGQSAAQLEGGRLQITLKNQTLFKQKWGLS